MRRPPSSAVDWVCIRKSASSVEALTCVVEAQTWMRARELAAVKLGCEPGELEVTEVSVPR